MALADWNSFRGIDHLRRDNFNQNLLYSLVDWFKWCSLNVGGFQNINYSYASGIYGGDFSRLRLVDTPNYTDGQVWEGFRSDWVWETGMEYGTQPNFCSGVYVDDVFYATASETGDYSHHINFPLGRVVFDSAVSTSSIINVDFSYRTVSYVKSGDGYFQELLFESYRVDRNDFLASGSGQWDQLAGSRRQMPVVGVELANRRYSPYELGSSQNYVFQDVIFYVLSESEDDRNQIVDTIAQQYDKTIWLYNRGLIKENDVYPVDLDYNGSPVSGAMQFPELVAETGNVGGFQYKKVALGNMGVTTMEYRNGIWRGILRTTVQGII